MRILKDILHIFLPNICLGCETVLTQNETSICTICYNKLPLTNFTINNDDAVLKIFHGRIALQNATALFHYHKKSLVQNLIYNLKYQNHESIGYLFGNWLAMDMITSNMYSNIDYIIPVPLHKKRFKKRGYNQVSKFGEQLANILKTNYLPNILIRKTATKTQTKKIRFDRWNNVSEIFYLTDTLLLENKHILLIDDIITTGATIEACCDALLKSKNLKISIAVMAISSS